MKSLRGHEHSDARRSGSSPQGDATPGKRTLAETLDHAASAPAAPAVQRSAEATGAPALDDDAVQAVAAQGVAGAGGSLPHLDLIQRSFGPSYDLSGVNAHVGGEAATAAKQIGAQAYATGTEVAFQQQPDLFTAAHEAAHVVQQRQGVQLKGGVGEQGDSYEQHADAVAERVVRGESAADLLGGQRGPAQGGGASRGVQRTPDAGAAAASDAGSDAATDSADAGTAVSPLRAKARAILEEVTGPILSTQPEYLKQTGLAHKTMTDNWATGGIMTGCNAYTGKYSTRMGLGYLGAFDLSSRCAGAFVRPGPGRFPKTGDIVKLTKLHVCVTLDCAGVGGSWTVIEAGQGGKSAGADILKRNTKTYNPGDVEGWVDIELWSDPGVRARQPTASPLIGNWEATSDGRVWRYSFDPTSTSVTYVDTADPTQSGSGTWERSSDGKDVIITWSASTETWSLAQVKQGKGKGTLSSSADGSSFKKLK